MNQFKKNKPRSKGIKVLFTEFVNHARFQIQYLDYLYYIKVFFTEEGALVDRTHHVHTLLS